MSGTPSDPTALPEVTVTAQRYVAPVASPDPFANVACSVEIYPFEGGPYTIDSNNGFIRAIAVSKTLRGGGDGTFTIDLAPGGPSGSESIPDWMQVITPASHVLIGMQRGADAAIVLDGLVTSVVEDQTWHSSADQGSVAMRSQRVIGSDFAWFYNTQNWYSLAMYGLTLNSGLQGQLGMLPASIVPFMSQGVKGNPSPAFVGDKWFQVMSASGIGMLNNTFIPYKGEYIRLPFRSVVSERFEQYPGIIIPVTEQFIGLESWTSKFMDIFPWPWYEFFVTTAPSGIYALGSGTSNIIASGMTFRMDAFPSALPAGPQMVARVTPIPRFDFTSLSSTGQRVVSDVDMTRWNALPLTALSGFGFYESTVGFSSDEVKNFYMVQPTAFSTVFNTGDSNIPFVFRFGGAADPASVHRYGYHPANGTTRWFYDPDGEVAQNGKLDIVQTVATLTAALASWWHPLALMARGSVEIPLSPSVYIGTRYRYAPFKDGVLWDFYVEGVSHRFVFGGHSSTTLTLTRGLPASIYADGQTGGLLQSIYTGNARRQSVQGSSGIYQIGLPEGTGQGLQVFSSPQAAAELSTQIWQGFVTPQYPSQ